MGNAMSKYQPQIGALTVGMTKRTIIHSGMMQIKLTQKNIHDRLASKEEARIVEMGRNEICFCGSGIKQKNCCSDINEKSVMESLLHRYFILTEKTKELTIEDNVRFVCKKGCSECCSEYF